MEKRKRVRRIISVLIPVVLLFFTFVPIFKTVNPYYKATAYSCIAYTIVVWENADENSENSKNTVVYWFPDNTKRFDELWRIKH